MFCPKNRRKPEFWSYGAIQAPLSLFQLYNFTTGICISIVSVQEIYVKRARIWFIGMRNKVLKTRQSDSTFLNEYKIFPPLPKNNFNTNKRDPSISMAIK